MVTRVYQAHKVLRDWFASVCFVEMLSVLNLRVYGHFR